MIEHEGRVSGSIDVARVAELLAETDDEELKAHYRDVLGESAVDLAAVAEDYKSAAEQPVEPAEVELDDLRDQAAALGVKVDGRWGADRLREEIAAYKPEGEDED